MKRSYSLLLLPLLLMGCSSDKELSRLCPQTAIVRELSRISDYGAETPAPENLVATAHLKNIEGECTYRDDGVDVDFHLNMEAIKGSRLGGDRIGFPYFISILDPESNILAKEMMTVDFRFPEAGKPAETSEKLHVFIPMSENTDGTNYRVLMGFQFTEEQLKAVRQNELDRFKKALKKP